MHALFRGLILALVAAWPALADSPTPASAAEAADAAASVVATSQSTIPASDADLAALRQQAEQLRALAADCNAKPCPVVETCEAAARLLQALSDAQAYLGAMETALNHGAAAAAAHHNNVVSQTRITSTNLKIAMEALAVKEYLSRFAQLMFDLASLSDDLKGMAEKGTALPGENAAQKLDTAYETIKDAISVANDMKGVVDDIAPPPGPPPAPAAPAPGGPGIVTSTPVGGGFSELAGQGQEMAGRLEDVKSSLSDAANAIDEARKELDKTGKLSKDVQANLLKAAAKIAFRELKAQVDREIEALKKQIAELEKNLAAEEKVLAGLFRERMRMNARRDAATDARRAVSAARDALIQCLARTCGMPSLTRPTLPNYYAPPAGMSARDLARHHGWGNALRDLAPRLAEVAARLGERFVVKDICPGGGGGTFVDPGGGSGEGPVTGGFQPRHEVRTRCAPCQPIADRIARILDEIDFRQKEIARIERRLADAIRLRADLKAAEARLADLNRYLAELREIIRNGQAFGISVAGKAEQDLALAEGRRVQLVGEIGFLQREIAAAEAERPKLAEHRGAVQELHAKRRVLRQQLAYCEEDKCRLGYYGELDTWINITGHNPMDPRDPGGPPPGAPPAGDERPRATVSVTRATGEGEAPGVFTITLSKPAAANLFIPYSFAGSAVRGADYQAVQVGAPLPAGSTQVEVTVTPIDDSAIEGPEAVEMILLPGEGYALGVPSAATMPFSDNDAPAQPAGTLQLAQSSYSIAENGGAILITVTRAGGSAGAVGVSYAATGGSATPGADFQPASGTLAWAAGDTAGKTISIPIVDDSVVESTETFQLTLSNPTGGATLGAPASATVSIADNDVASGPCGPTGNAWQGNAGSYFCSGNCDPCPSPQSLTVNGDVVTLSPFHAGGAATFQGCGPSLQSQSSSLVYFGQANHRATITRNGDRAFSATIQSAGGGSCQMSCFRP